MHEDQSKAWDHDLNEWEQANIRVYLLAKRYFDDWFNRGRPLIDDRVEGSRSHFFLNGLKISNNHISQILHDAWGKKLKSRWILCVWNVAHDMLTNPPFIGSHFSTWWQCPHLRSINFAQNIWPISLLQAWIWYKEGNEHTIHVPKNVDHKKITFTSPNV